VLATPASLTLDLAEVAFLDRDGVALLRRYRIRDVTLVNCSPFVAEQLKTLAERSAGRTPEGRDMQVEAEQALVERLRAGDPEALETLMERSAARVYRLAYSITRNAGDAEEVVQDVFLNVFRNVRGFQGRAAVGTWLYRVTANAALNKRRGKRLEVETSLEAWLPTFKPDGHREGERAFLLADWSRTPESELLSREMRATLERAIEALPDRYRAVLVLRDVEGLSSEEAAAALGESVASLKSCLHRARMALREHLTRRLASSTTASAR
jgi:RNA polymerase sigma-70 factor (ECF subfamily)